MFVNPDFSDLLKLFNGNGVRYPVIGGYAVVQYAEPRYTNRYLWISIDEQNARAVYQALRAFGVPLSGLTERDSMEDGTFYQMGVPPLRVDILMGIPGLEFDPAWQQRVEVQFDDPVVPFISRSDLIRSKTGIWPSPGFDRCGSAVVVGREAAKASPKTIRRRGVMICGSGRIFRTLHAAVW